MDMPVPDDQGWDFEPHLCRTCRGRIMSRTNGDTVEYRCASCGNRGADHVDDVCCCGVTWGTHGHVLVCQKNPVRGPQVPQEYVARGELPKRERGSAQRRTNPVHLPGSMFE